MAFTGEVRRQYFRDRRARLKSLNLCRWCEKRSVEPRHALCDLCAESRRITGKTYKLPKPPVIAVPEFSEEPMDRVERLMRLATGRVA